MRHFVNNGHITKYHKQCSPFRGVPYGRQAGQPTAPDWPSRRHEYHTLGRQVSGNPMWRSPAARHFSQGIPPGSWGLPCTQAPGPPPWTPRSSPPSLATLGRCPFLVATFLRGDDLELACSPASPTCDLDAEFHPPLRSTATPLPLHERTLPSSLAR